MIQLRANMLAMAAGQCPPSPYICISACINDVRIPQEQLNEPLRHTHGYRHKQTSVNIVHTCYRISKAMVRQLTFEICSFTELTR